MLRLPAAAARRGLATSSMLYPMTNLQAIKTAEPLRIVSGRGCRVTDSNGKEYIEGMAGLWCTSLGWGNEELIEAVDKQMRELSYYHGFTGRQTPAAEALAEALIARAPERLQGGRVFFGMSGSDANDTMLRVLWNYNRARGRPEKTKVLARNRGYHGTSVAAGSLTCLPAMHGITGLPLKSLVPRHLTCASYYREGLLDGEHPETEAEFVARCANELEAAIVGSSPAGAHAIAAFIAEPLQVREGASSTPPHPSSAAACHAALRWQGAGGVVVPPAGYFEA
jgi:4-aminobutyrate--pyruvate transaminase